MELSLAYFEFRLRRAVWLVWPPMRALALPALIAAAIGEASSGTPL
jgi:hypothetical protein